MQVELHCATGFEELDNALRTGLSDELSPEQLTILLQGTAGLYQDLRVEMKKRMKVFEEYALAEILKLPPGLLANPVGADIKEAPVDDEEERRVDEELKSMQLEIAESKQKGRDTRATIKFLEKLMKDVKQKLSELEAVPNVLGSTQTLEQDVEFITKKGSAIEDGCERLDALQGSSIEHSDDKDIDKTMVAAMSKGAKTGMMHMFSSYLHINLI